MRLGERLRWKLALVGVGLWLAGPVIFALGGAAKHRYRCRDRIFTGSFDDCFNDYLPVLEVFFVPLLALVLTYPFARFAFSLYAPPPQDRSRRWRLGARDGGAAYWPLLQSFALAGLAWAIWSWSGYALTGLLLPFHLYWAAFSAWFLFAFAAGIPERKSD